MKRKKHISKYHIGNEGQIEKEYVPSRRVQSLLALMSMTELFCDGSYNDTDESLLNDDVIDIHESTDDCANNDTDVIDDKIDDDIYVNE